MKYSKQNDSKATFVKLIEKEDAELDFNLDAQKLENMVKAYVENPTSYLFVGNDRIKVFKAKAISGFEALKPGEIYADKKQFVVKAKTGALSVLKCQAPGGKVLAVKDFLNGYRFTEKKVSKCC